MIRHSSAKIAQFRIQTPSNLPIMTATGSVIPKNNQINSVHSGDGRGLPGRRKINSCNPVTWQFYVKNQIIVKYCYIASKTRD
jgi:hypothetical protein